MDGKKYIRIDPFKPYLPRGFLGGLYINSYTPLDLYVEFMYNNRYIPKYIKDYNNGYDPINTLLSDIPLSGIDPNIPLCINNNICQKILLNRWNLEINDNDILLDMIKNIKFMKNNQ